jgi:hypothetical protein
MDRISRLINPVIIPIILLFGTITILFNGQTLPAPAAKDYWILSTVLSFILVTLLMNIMWLARRANTPFEAITACVHLAICAVGLIFIYATAYKEFGLIDGDTSVRNAKDFLYFSIVTWTTLGYGDIKPTIGCRLFAASEALFGYIFMGLYLAFIFKAITVLPSHSVSDTSASSPAQASNGRGIKEIASL